MSSEGAFLRQAFQAIFLKKTKPLQIYGIFQNYIIKHVPHCFAGVTSSVNMVNFVVKSIALAMWVEQIAAIDIILDPQCFRRMLAHAKGINKFGFLIFERSLIHPQTAGVNEYLLRTCQSVAPCEKACFTSRPLKYTRSARVLHQEKNRKWFNKFSALFCRIGGGLQRDTLQTDDSASPSGRHIIILRNLAARMAEFVIFKLIRVPPRELSAFMFIFFHVPLK